MGTVKTRPAAGAEMDEARAQLQRVEASVARGEDVSVEELLAARGAADKADLRSDLIGRRAAASAEAARLQRIDDIGDELVATVVPVRARIDRAVVEAGRAIARLCALVTEHNDELLGRNHELTELCRAGTPAHVYLEPPYGRLTMHGDHRYALADPLDQIRRALVAGVPSGQTGQDWRPFG